MSKIRRFLVNHCPWLGIGKRFSLALADALLPRKASYSQHSEDVAILALFRELSLVPEKAVYVDVGANHPTVISNTYLLYRHGFSGILIEPNTELARLLKLFRRRDIVLNVAAREQAGVVPFFVSKAPVGSSIVQARRNDTWRSYPIPMVRVDECLGAILPPDFVIGLLSVDVEGHNYEVLTGCEGILGRTILLCIEFDEDDNKRRYTQYLHHFEQIQEIGCNMLLMNTNMALSHTFISR